jgi:hypothetical protein
MRLSEIDKSAFPQYLKDVEARLAATGCSRILQLTKRAERAQKLVSVRSVQQDGGSRNGAPHSPDRFDSSSSRRSDWPLIITACRRQLLPLLPATARCVTTWRAARPDNYEMNLSQQPKLVALHIRIANTTTLYMHLSPHRVVPLFLHAGGWEFRRVAGALRGNRLAGR